MDKRKIIIAVTGASGAIYAKLLLEKIIGEGSAHRSFRQKAEEGHGTRDGAIAIIFSDNAREIWKYELGSELQVPEGMTLYENNDFYAPFASGSSDWDTMIICPASMGIIGRIAGGISNDLITRAADVMLKERRRLIVVPRETPYSLIHLTNMKLITEAGAIVCPATPSFYHKPVTIEDLAQTVVERVLDLAGISGEYKRWQTT
jgi:4-hydroxy-3-polyprenylbenzoate decarboxylase